MRVKLMDIKFEKIIVIPSVPTVKITYRKFPQKNLAAHLLFPTCSTVSNFAGEVGLSTPNPIAAGPLLPFPGRTEYLSIVEMDGLRNSQWSKRPR